MLDVSKRVYFLCIFVGLLVSKYLGLNDVIDDVLLLVVGAMLGKEVLSGRMKSGVDS